MTKRIYDVAKELGKPVKELLDILKEHKIEKTNFSAATERDIEILKRHYAPRVVKRVTAVRIGGVDVDRKAGQLRGPAMRPQGTAAPAGRPGAAAPQAPAQPGSGPVRVQAGARPQPAPAQAPAATPAAGPQPKAAEAAAKVQPKAPEVAAKVQPKAPEGVAKAQPAVPAGAAQVQPKAPEAAAKAQPKAPETAAKPQPKVAETATKAQPTATAATAKAQPAATAGSEATVKAPQAGTAQPQPRPQAGPAQPRPQAGTTSPRPQQPGAAQPRPQQPGTVQPQARPQGAGQPRPQGVAGGQSRPQGQRPVGQGGSYSTATARPQGQGQRPGPVRPGVRPQGQGSSYSQGGRPQGQGLRREGQGGGYGQGPRPGGTRPSGYAPRPQGAAGPEGRPGGTAPRSGGPAPGARRPSGGSALPKTDSRPRRPEAAKGGRDERREGSKNAGKSRKNVSPIKGSYATKESRPNRSAGHQMPANRGLKKGPARPPVAAEPIIRPSSVEVGESISVQDFAKLIKREVNEVIKTLFLLGQMVTINQDIDFDTAQLIGSEFDVEVLPAPQPEDPTEIPPVEDPEELRTTRPPVITVMGHVDHGKTSILDAIRKTNVTAREAGGITQHIGAYKVNYQGKQIVFLDTPGHEAFTAMRARGAQVTDIAILVVAADDGVMPQTIEAINHAKAAKVPIIVAINKMDRAGANPDHVKQQLAEQELIPEDWGGETIMVPCSAYTKEGITDLLDMILLVAEVQELKANADLPAHGTIIEAQLDKGRGPVATVLIQRGTLRVGDTIIAGTCYGKVRAMINDRGEKVKKATPSTPVEVLGLNDVPEAGDILDSTEERIARSVANKRLAQKKEKEIKAPSKVSLDDLYQRIKDGELKELNIVVKADVQGTIEALKASLQKIKNEEVKVVVVHAGVGAITESDVMLASAANALIIGFNVRPDANARKAAENAKVDLRTYRVIYDALNDVEAAIKGMLAPKFTEVVQGRVEVRQLISIMKLLVAGCYVLEGKVTNNSKVRIIRDGIVLPVEDQVESLRRFKDDVKEVQQGYECGITLSKFRDLKEGDIFEVYAMEEVAVE